MKTSATWPATAMPENGSMPDVTPLANVTMSGLKSQCSTPNQVPVRPKPVMVSSQISSTS